LKSVQNGKLQNFCTTRHLEFISHCVFLLNFASMIEKKHKKSDKRHFEYFRHFENTNHQTIENG
jgi:hypothetical protein